MDNEQKITLATPTLTQGHRTGKVFAQVVNQINSSVLNGKPLIKLEIYPVKELQDLKSRLEKYEKALEIIRDGAEICSDCPYPTPKSNPPECQYHCSNGVAEKALEDK